MNHITRNFASRMPSSFKKTVEDQNGQLVHVIPGGVDQALWMHHCTINGLLMSITRRKASLPPDAGAECSLTHCLLFFEKRWPDSEKSNAKSNASSSSEPHTVFSLPSSVTAHFHSCCYHSTLIHTWMTANIIKGGLKFILYLLTTYPMRILKIILIRV